MAFPPRPMTIDIAQLSREIRTGMNKFFRAILIISLATLALVAATLLRPGDPIERFLKINKATYLTNLAQWNEALKTVEALEPEGFRGRALAQVRMNALLHKGRPEDAQRIWLDYAGSRQRSTDPSFEPLMLFALLLAGNKSAASEYAAQSKEELFGQFAEYLRHPTSANYRTLLDLAAARYRTHELPFATIEWLEAHRKIDGGRAGEALRVLTRIVDRYPEQACFRFSRGHAHLAENRVDLGCSYLISGRRLLAAKMKGRSEPRDMPSKNHAAQIERQLLEFVYGGKTQKALAAMGPLDEAFGLDLSKILAAIAHQDSLTAAEAFALQKRLPEDVDSAALVRHQDWLGWADATNLNEQRFSVHPILDGDPLTLSAANRKWTAYLKRPSADVGYRVLLMRMRPMPHRGIGPGFTLTAGWKQESAYLEADETWTAFDVPLALDKTLKITLELTNAAQQSLYGEPGAKGPRKLALVEATVLDLPRLSVPAEPKP